MTTGRKLHVILFSNKWIKIAIAAGILAALGIGIGVGFAMSGDSEPVVITESPEETYESSPSPQTEPMVEEPLEEPFEELPELTPETLPVLLPVTFLPLGDVFTLFSLDEGAVPGDYLVYTGLSLGFPLNGSGYYLSEPFLLEADETIEIVFNSDSPIGSNCSDSESEGTLCVQIKYLDEIFQTTRIVYPGSYALYRVADMWESKIRYTADEDGPHQLWIFNYTGHASECQYTLRLERNG